MDKLQRNEDEEDESLVAILDKGDESMIANTGKIAFLLKIWKKLYYSDQLSWTS